MDKKDGKITTWPSEDGRNEPATTISRVFTAREHETMELIAKGFSSKRIANELSISEDTVESHRRNILRKVGAGNMIEAVAYSFRNNLIR